MDASLIGTSRRVVASFRRRSDLPCNLPNPTASDFPIDGVVNGPDAEMGRGGQVLNLLHHSRRVWRPAHMLAAGTGADSLKPLHLLLELLFQPVKRGSLIADGRATYLR